MALLQQWIRQRPWLSAGLLGVVGGVAGFANQMMPWSWTSTGTLSHPRSQIDHPMRNQILTTLEEKPGLCYRELQKELDAANGTLRHHLDVLQSQFLITVVHVNGRSCYFAGSPTKVEIIQGVTLDDEEAARLMPVGLSLVQRMIVEELKLGEVPPRSQSALARTLGRSRATIHSAIKVLRRRGIMRMDRLELAPHLVGGTVVSNEKSTVRELDYEWTDERR